MSLQDVFNALEAEQNESPKLREKLRLLQEEERDGKGRIFPVSPWASRLIVSLDDTPVSWRKITSGDKRLRVTTGNYAICYKPPGSRNYKASAPFVFWTDLVGFKVSLANPGHLKFLAEQIPEVAWILRNTTFCDELFDIARKHAGVPIPFCLKVPEYVEKLKSQGIKDDEIFFSHKCSEKDFEEFYQYKSWHNFNAKAYYKDIVKKAEDDFADK